MLACDKATIATIPKRNKYTGGIIIMIAQEKEGPES